MVCTKQFNISVPVKSNDVINIKPQMFIFWILKSVTSYAVTEIIFHLFLETVFNYLLILIGLIIIYIKIYF